MTHHDSSLADACVHRLFEIQAERRPDAVAAVFYEGAAGGPAPRGPDRLLYGELNRRVNQLAHHLRGLGVGPEVLVALCAERSLEALIGLLAVLKAGGAYVPIDPTYPGERVAFMLADTRAPVLLSQARWLPSLPRAVTSRARVVLLDRDREMIACCSDLDPPPAAGPDHLAYVIYTSGSTGKPKGTLLAHRGLANHARAYMERFDLGPDSRVLQLASLSFDASVSEIVMALVSGATLVLGTRTEMTPGPGLINLLRTAGVTIATFPPSALAALPEGAEGALPALRDIIVAGEPCPPELVARWAPGRRLFNAYGPTEFTVCATVAGCSPDGAPPPIGHPIPNARCFVLDASMRPVLDGVPGELYLGGAGLARGYLGRPDLTAARFVPDPFGPNPGARLYRTGDLVRRLPDGALFFLGRIDHQVKIRGFRIELGEIEAALASHPSVRQAVVVARENAIRHSAGSRRLVAYFVGSIAPTDLREFLEQRLPEYMIPAAFVALPAFPLTPTGKIDRRSLPAPGTARPALRQEFVAPRTAAEEVLSVIWQALLGVEPVGVRDDFFDLGGDSLLAFQVVARASAAGLRITTKQPWDTPTVEALAAGAAWGSLEVSDPITGPVPLIPIQRGFLGAWNLRPEHQWNNALLIEIREAIAPSLLEEAVRQIQCHHDALRLRFFRDESGAFRQENAGALVEVPFSVFDLSHVPDAGLRDAVEQEAAALQGSLRLAEGPLFRVAHFELGGGRGARLLLMFHQLVADGLSARIVLEDLHAAIEQMRTGRAVRLPPKTISFKAWAERLVEYASSPSILGQLAFWTRAASHTPVRLPLDFPGGANTMASEAFVSAALSAEETRALIRRAAEQGAHLQDLLLTALVEASSTLTGERALSVAVVGHGRHDLGAALDVSRTVGWFNCLFPAHLTIPPRAAGPLAAVMAVQERLRAIPEHGIGFGLLRFLAGPDAAAAISALPAPEVTFDYNGQIPSAFPEGSPFRETNEPVGPSSWGDNARPRIWMIFLAVEGGRLRVAWSYSANLHRRETVLGVTGAFMEWLRAFAERTGSR